MNLARDGQEFARWTITTKDGLTAFEVEFDGTNTWHPATYNDGTARLLVCGPGRTPTDGAVPLTSGTHSIRIRCIDTPEVVVRSAGHITVGG